MAKSIKINFIYNLLLQVSKVLFPLITAPYIARVLDPEGVGIANFVNTYSSYFALFAVLGVPLYGIREIAKIKDKNNEMGQFVSEIMSIELISTIVVSLLYVISLFYINQLNEHFTLFILAGITLYITPLKIEWFFTGREEFSYITYRSLFIKIISVICLFVFVKTKNDLLSYILLNAFAVIANEIWNYGKLYRIGIRPKICFKGLKKHINPILILFLSNIAISIYVMLDTIMLGFQSNYMEVGFYNASMHIVKALLPIATALSMVAIPRVSTYIHSNEIARVNELMNKSLGIVSFLSFPLTIGIIILAPIFVPLFLGDSFNGSIIPLQIASFLLLSIGFNNLNGIQILIGLGKDRLFLYSVLLGAVANFILNYLLIPKYGAIGASLSSVYAETQILLVNEYFVRKYTDVRITDFRDLIKAFLGSLSFIPLYVFLKIYFNDWMLVIIMVMACGIIYIVSQYLLKNNMLREIISLVTKKL